MGVVNMLLAIDVGNTNIVIGVFRGETLVLNITNRRTIIRPTQGGRVRGVFVPGENTQQQNSGQRSQ